jgi:hypothetical protein
MFEFSARPKAPYFSIGPKLTLYVRLLRAHIPCKFQKNRPSRFGVIGQKLVFQCAIQDFPHSIGSAAALAYNTSHRHPYLSLPDRGFSAQLYEMSCVG